MRRKAKNLNILWGKWHLQLHFQPLLAANLPAELHTSQHPPAQGTREQWPWAASANLIYFKEKKFYEGEKKYSNNAKKSMILT